MPPREILVDTNYLAAIIDPRDDLNGIAVVLASELSETMARLVVPDEVLIELGNYFCRSVLRVTAGDSIGEIRRDPAWMVVPTVPSLLAAAEARYRLHSDKDWSMTDCISMEVMLQRRIKDVATTDRGFAQAGFNVLLG